MPAVTLYGKPVAQNIRSVLEEELAKVPRLKLGILCPNTPASKSYVTAQIKLAASLNIDTEVACCGEGVSQEGVEAIIHQWNTSPDVHGIFIHQPFGNGFDIHRMSALVEPSKDVESIHPYNQGLRHFSELVVGSCTALAVLEMIKCTGVKLQGAEVVVVGQGKVVGRPTAVLLSDSGATVTACNKSTFDRGELQKHVERAEILVVAVGKPELIRGHWIKEGAVVIDVGCNSLGQGKFVGDVEFFPASMRASFITPAMGGVGPVTAMISMQQLLMAYRLQQRELVNQA